MGWTTRGPPPENNGGRTKEGAQLVMAASSTPEAKGTMGSQAESPLHSWDLPLLQIDPKRDIVMGLPLGSGAFGTVRQCLATQ